MRKKELYEHVLAYFERTMDATETELHFSNPFELLVAVVLSAQCTDKRINQVTPRLFADFPVPEAMAATTPEVIYDYIRTDTVARRGTQNSQCHTGCGFWQSSPGS